LQAIARRLHRAARPPWLHGEVARRMVERLALIKTQPQRVHDWWSWLGASGELLAKQYPRATLASVEAFEPRSLDKPRWWQAAAWRRGPQTLREAEVPEASTDLLWANMMLHMVPEIEVLLQRWRKLIAADGFLMFSTLGPGSFAELRELYRKAGWPPPLAPLVDMHDLGDMLVHAGFAEPVMDQELITLTYSTPREMLDELRLIGGNAATDRHQGLRTPRWRERLLDALGVSRDAQGRVRMTLEVVYGHAFCPAPRPRVAAQTEIPVEQMRALMRSSRPRGNARGA
jgi:malonyl-CoA O-methyltransferase